MKRLVKVGAAVILASFIVSACSESSRPKWLEIFYNANYAYRKSTVNINDNVEEVVNIFEGKITSSPYKQYERVIEPRDSILKEIYYHGSGKMVTAVLCTDDGSTTQLASRPYPYGYDQDLTFKKDRVENYNEHTCTVYTTEYSEDLADIFNPDAGTAKISQEYYVDNESDRLLCIITDLTDLNNKTESANLGSAGESTGETQEQEPAVSTVHKLEILSYDDKISITIPDI